MMEKLREKLAGCCGGEASEAPREVLETPRGSEEIVAEVRQRYGGLAVAGQSCCGPASTCGPEAGEIAGRIGYSAEELAAVPANANMGLGCGAPIDHLALETGETVLDLGSGPGLDAFLAAQRVGPQGRVIGVDMTPEMIERARQAADAAGLGQVEFRQGRLEDLPVDDASVDAVTSNCVINLVPDKGTVFREVARVLKTDGRLVISDIVLEAPLPRAVERDLLAYVGCVAGAELRDDYFAKVAAAGLGEVDVLADVDVAAVVGDSIPQEIVDLLARTGVSADELRGKIRSVTYRAVKV